MGGAESQCPGGENQVSVGAQTGGRSMIFSFGNPKDEIESFAAIYFDRFSFRLSIDLPQVSFSAKTDFTTGKVQFPFL